MSHSYIWLFRVEFCGGCSLVAELGRWGKGEEKNPGVEYLGQTGWIR